MCAQCHEVCIAFALLCPVFFYLFFVHFRVPRVNHLDHIKVRHVKGLMAYDCIIRALYTIQQRLFLKSVKYNEVPLVFGNTSLARYSYQVSDETVLQVLLTAWDKVKNRFDTPASAFYSAGLERVGGLEVHKRIELLTSEIPLSCHLERLATGY
jgi:hypothetical protein